MILGVPEGIRGIQTKVWHPEDFVGEGLVPSRLAVGRLNPC